MSVTITLQEIAAGEDIPEASQPFWCRCGSCAHEWIAAYYPMTLAKFAKIAKDHSSCPKCGGYGLCGRNPTGSAAVE